MSLIDFGMFCCFLLLAVTCLGIGMRAIFRILTEKTKKSSKTGWLILTLNLVTEFLEMIPVVGKILSDYRKKRKLSVVKEGDLDWHFARPSTIKKDTVQPLYKSAFCQLVFSILIASISSYIFCRPICHYLVYEIFYVWGVGNIILPMIWISPFIFLTYLQIRRLKGPRANTGMAVLTFLSGLGLVFSLVLAETTIKGYLLALKFTPTEINEFPIVDPEQDRDTPFEVVVTGIQNHVTKANYEVLPENTHPLRVNGNFGYAGLITAQTTFMKFDSSPGLVVYDDGPKMPQHGRARLVEFTDIPYSPGRNLFANIYWHLKTYRMWGDFDEVFLIQLKEGDDSSWHFAAPYTIKKIRFPGLLVPEWGGVVFVNVGNGVTFDKSAKEIKEDKEYQGINLFPISLAKLYVDVRNYDSPEGFLGDVWQWMFNTQYEIEVSHLDGYNQQPNVYNAKDGKSYYQFSVEPLGHGAQVLKECHFVNTTTGEYSKFTPKDIIINPDTACRVTRESLPDHNWGEYDPESLKKVKRSGTTKNSKMLTLEPLPRSTNGQDIYYRIFITSTSFSGSENSERVFVNGQTKVSRVFRRREEYLRLLNLKKDLFADTESYEVKSESVSEIPIPTNGPISTDLESKILQLLESNQKTQKALLENQILILEKLEKIQPLNETSKTTISIGEDK